MAAAAHAGSKAVGFFRGTAGARPTIDGLGEVEGVSFPIEVKRGDQVAEFIASLSRSASGWRLRFVIDLHDGALERRDEWVIGLLTQTLSTVGQEVAWLDLSERLVDIPFLEPAPLLRRLVPGHGTGDEFPLLLATIEPPPDWLGPALDASRPRRTLRVSAGYEARLGPVPRRSRAS